MDLLRQNTRVTMLHRRGKLFRYVAVLSSKGRTINPDA
jgi:hypothetical protein